ncbi:MAG: TfoX/Sxy family protein [Chloroflexi bacterium]|nr:TfoX/Sxy family protein [Chloroflexota bacterium]
MPYDTLLASRIRAALGLLPSLVEKKMFGGVGFLVNGNMACGVHKNDLIVRVGAASYEEALFRPQVSRPMYHHRRGLKSPAQRESPLKRTSRL